jgi:hypothetical protein
MGDGSRAAPPSEDLDGIPKHGLAQPRAHRVGKGEVDRPAEDRSEVSL